MKKDFKQGDEVPQWFCQHNGGLLFGCDVTLKDNQEHSFLEIYPKQRITKDHPLLIGTGKDLKVVQVWKFKLFPV